MIEIIAKWISDAKTEVSSHKNIYLVLSVILIVAFLVRVWRVDQILGFYFDQGRDAKVIWDFWHNGRFFLIGPTTGIEGIFRGPWYYWLIAPWYLLGNGDPVWPSVFLAFTTVVAIALLYVSGTMIGDRVTGIVATVIASFSYYLVQASRWLSNPTPMLLISMILILSMFLVINGKKWAWVLIALMLGMAMQFGSAAEIFYFPAVALFAIWLASRSGQRKNFPNIRIFLIASFLFLIILLPQIIFDIRHDGVLSNAVKQFLFEKESFAGSWKEGIGYRSEIYFDVFSNKIFPTDERLSIWFGVITLGILLFNWRSLISNRRIVVTLLVFISPLIGLLFYQGNYGIIYDYYFTGYYLVFVLILSSVFTSLKPPAGNLLAGIFLLLFLSNNGDILKTYLASSVSGETSILLGNQKQVVDWVYKDVGDRPFNVDVYVPPVIPHAYDYLFLWWGMTRYGGKIPATEQVPLLYTLYEQDPPHPERLEAWYKRQEKIGVIEETVRFGGITVERRERIKVESRE